MKREFILQVKEFLERSLDAFEIAHRMHVDPADVQLAIEIIKQIVT